MGYDESVFMTYETFYKLKDSEAAQRNLPMLDIEDKISMLMVDTVDGLEGMDLFNLKKDIENAGKTGEEVYIGTADELLSGTSEQTKRLAGYGNILIYISLISTALALISIFVLTINERRYEFGVLYALGARKKQMRDIIMSEALIISGIGGVVGTFLTYALLSVFKSLISLKMNIPYLDMSFERAMPVALACIAIAIITGIIAAACSSYQISKGEVYRLLRENE